MNLRRKLLRGLGVVAAIAVAAGAGLAVYVARTWDRDWDAPLPDIRASRDPDVIRRGEYLVYGPAHCVECHTSGTAEYERAMERGERVALRGGMEFTAGPLGTIYSKNLTPDPETGIGRYSDAQIARLLRWAVRPNGKATVQLLMPFGNMSDADITAIVSFLRAQPPVRNEIPPNRFTLVGKIVKSVAPVFKPRRAINPVAVAPESQPTAARGEYLARTVANCTGCHTKHDPLTFANVSAEFAGGEEMEPATRAGADPGVWFRTPNLTPAPGSALTRFPDRATFVARFKKGGVQYPGSPMPWEAFGRMSEEDIGALYEFFHTLGPQPGPTGEPTFKNARATAETPGAGAQSPKALARADRASTPRR